MTPKQIQDELANRALNLHDTHATVFTSDMTPEELREKFYQMINEAKKANK